MPSIFAPEKKNPYARHNSRNDKNRARPPGGPCRWRASSRRCKKQAGKCPARRHSHRGSGFPRHRIFAFMDDQYTLPERVGHIRSDHPFGSGFPVHGAAQSPKRTFRIPSRSTELMPVRAYSFVRHQNLSASTCRPLPKPKTQTQQITP